MFMNMYEGLPYEVEDSIHQFLEEGWIHDRERTHRKCQGRIDIKHITQSQSDSEGTIQLTVCVWYTEVRCTCDFWEAQEEVEQ